MEFSGERVIPGMVEPTLWAEHLARYGLAARFAPGRRVLDFGCGTGYGTSLLSSAGAALAVGVDLAPDALAYARSTFRRDGLLFVGSDCLHAAFADRSFELIVSFETIEHVSSYEQYLSEAVRLLVPEGRMVLSTPNKRTYSDERPGDQNPFHTHEFYGGEFRDILESHFPVVDLYGQWISEGVAFTHLASEGSGFEPEEERSLRILEPRIDDPGERCDYLVAVCSPTERAGERPNGLQHYFFMSGTNEVGEKRHRILELQDEVEERTQWAQERDRAVVEREEEIRRLAAELDAVRLAREAEGVRASTSLEDTGARVQDQIQRLSEELQATQADRSEERGRLEAKLEGARSRCRTLEREAIRLAVEVKQLRHQAAHERGKARDSAVLPPPRRPRWTLERPQEEILFIQSGGAEIAERCLEILRTKVDPDGRVLYVTHDAEVVPHPGKMPDGSRILVADPSLTQLFWLSLLFRWGEFRTVALMLTGEHGYRRFKLLGLGLCSKRLVIFNENGDCFFFTWRKLLRHVTWRLREWITPDGPWRSVASAARVVRAEGAGEVVQRIRRRLADDRRRRIRYRRRRLPSRMSPQTFPRHERPELSIVIPVHDQEQLTWCCLRSIHSHAGDLSYEVIVADDASGPATRAMLARQTNVRVVRLDTNRGFVGACNAGAEVAQGDYVLFLNSDTEILPGTLRALVDTFADDPATGVVGAKLMYPDGTLQEAGGIVWRDGEAWNYGRGGDPLEPAYNYLREVDYCSGAALAVRRSLFEELNGFDAVFAPGYWEDVDLCFRARAAGFRVVYQPESVVVHLEGATAGRSTDRGMKAHQVTNQQTFRERWRDELADHVEHDPGLLFLARDRQRAKIALVIDHYVPTPDKDAGSYAMYMVLLSLRRLGYRVLFWPDNRYRTPGYADELQRKGVEILYGPIDFRQYIREVGPFLDCVLIYRAKIAHKYLQMIEDRVARRIYICVDLEHVREGRRAALTGGASLPIEQLRTREAEVVAGVERVAVHSPVEQEIFEAEFPGIDVLLLPLPVKTGRMTKQPFERRSDLLFVGSTHPPNVDAVEFYRDRLCPLLRERLPAVRLTVAGEVSKHVRGATRCPELDCVGFVPDLAALYGERRVFVAPLRYGAGIKGKILEAMSFGLPVVTSSVGAEGIAIEDGVSGFIADDPEAFVAAVARLYEDGELWDRVRRAGRALIERDYSEASFRERVRRLVEPKACDAADPAVTTASPKLAAAMPSAR